MVGRTTGGITNGTTAITGPGTGGIASPPSSTAVAASGRVTSTTGVKNDPHRTDPDPGDATKAPRGPWNRHFRSACLSYHRAAAWFREAGASADGGVISS